MHSPTDVYAFFQKQKQSGLVWQSPKIGPSVWTEDRIARPQDNDYDTRGNRVMRIPLPREDMIVEKSFLQVQFDCGASGATRKALANYAASMFEEIRLRIGTFDHVVRDYNLLLNFFNEIETPQAVKSQQLFDNYGYGPDWFRDTQATSTQTYNIPLRWIGFDRGVYPLESIYELSKTPMDTYIELVLAEPTTCIETDGTNPWMSIKQIRLFYDKICSQDNTFRDALVSEMRLGGGFFSFPTIVKYQNPVSGSVSDLQIQFKGNNISDITHVLLDLTSRNNPLVRSKFQNYPKDFGSGCAVRFYQMEVGGKLYPKERVDATDQAQQSYADYTRSFGFADNIMSSKIPAPVSLQQFNGVTNSGLFFMHFNFHPMDTDLHSGIRTEDVINPFNLRNETRSMIFKLDMGNSPPPGVSLTAYHFIRYNQIVQITPSGQVVKVWQ